MSALAWFQGWKGQVAILLIALLALVAPRLITAAPLDMLDGGQAAGRFADPAEEVGQNFPGSAFFFAEGAFDPVPGVETVKSQHVLGLEAVKAAPAAIFRGVSPLDSYRALNCLTNAIYYEAGNEPEDGQRAVAQVVLNRVRSPLWPNSVCGVVYQGSERADYKCQFTFSCDGAMARAPAAAAWARARRVAADALAGRVYAPVGLATHYHTLAVRPAWSSSLAPVAVIGAHIFYRNPGFNGTAAAFRDIYLGRETISGPARTVWPARPAQPPVELMGAPYIPPAATLAPGAPAVDWPAPSPRTQNDSLPDSGIRAEYRNSGRPLI
ncbi:cell wall hydrolase [Sphingobium sp. HBC34]|uniref:Cell wall hydrolase n=1 Tax=Sphingobium cyanobacteriorum TaxID=3063954 RepID=A0ABT8ZKE5_9SPHN|nr:cell wall hydrolase [Sphingobium sp. HBC34]MDO7834666.1 cell wall hydrolase [Sphingobium sp. HBC34]